MITSRRARSRAARASQSCERVGRARRRVHDERSMSHGVRRRSLHAIAQGLQARQLQARNASPARPSRLRLAKAPGEEGLAGTNGDTTRRENRSRRRTKNGTRAAMTNVHAGYGGDVQNRASHQVLAAADLTDGVTLSCTTTARPLEIRHLARHSMSLEPRPAMSNELGHASHGRERSPVLVCHHEMLHTHAIDMWPSDGGQGVGLSKRQPCGRASELRTARVASSTRQLMETAAGECCVPRPQPTSPPPVCAGFTAWQPGSLPTLAPPSNQASPPSFTHRHRPSLSHAHAHALPAAASQSSLVPPVPCVLRARSRHRGCLILCMPKPPRP